jgi:hypothetical protein
MKFAVASALLSLLLSAGSFASTSAAAAKSPVEKVVNLLTELKGRLTDDEKAEQQVYDKYACWCEETTARKAAAIESARDALRQLGQDILSLKGKAATLAAEIKQLLADIKANEEAQQEATAIRQKENAAFLAESAEMKQALAALEKATALLKGATGSSGALLQRRSSAKEVGASLQAVVTALPTRAASKLSLAALSQLRRTSAELVATDRYAPQSMTIQGILEDMYKTFATELETDTNAESTSNRNFEDFINTKELEHAAMKESLETKEKEKAETEVLLAEALEEYDVTEQQMKADIEFFDVTKSACTDKSSEWKTRSSLRAEELAGIDEALKILTSDEARELFSKAIKPGVATPSGFLQLTAAPVSSHDSRAAAAAATASRRAFGALKKQATGAHSLRLAKLAATVKTADVGHFDKVIAAIDTMLQTLQDEDTDDISKRDQCKHEYQQVNRTISEVSWKIEVNEAKIAKHEARIEKKEAEKALTIEDIAKLKEDMKTMEEQRTAENQAFKAAKKDDEDAIALLEEAKAKLSEYYVKNEIELGPIQGLIQQPEFDVSPDQAPDATFSGKGKRKGESKGIISILTNLIEDLGNEIKLATQEEAAAQLSYEKAMAAATKLLGELEDKVVMLEGVVADQQEQKSDETALKTGNEANKTSTTEYHGKIKPDCDWIIGSFEERVTKRASEKEGLTQAKAFLAGYQVPEALVQKKSPQHL